MKRIVRIGFFVLTFIYSGAITFAFGGATSSNAIFYMRISPNGQYVGVGRLDNILCIYDISQKKLVRSLNNLSKAIDFTPDSKHYVFQSEENIIHICSIQSGDEVKRLELPFSISAFDFTKDLSQGVVGTLYGELYWINFETSKLKKIKDKDENNPSACPILDLKILEERNLFLSLSRFTKSDSKKVGEKLKQKGKDVFESWQKKGLALWDLEHQKPLFRFSHRLFRGHSYIDLIPEKGKLIAQAESGYAALIDLYKRKIIWEPIIDYQNKKIDASHPGVGCGFLDDGKSFLVIKKEAKASLLQVWSSLNKFRPILIHKIPSSLLGGEGKFVTDPSNNLIVLPASDGGILLYRFDSVNLKVKRLWKAKPSEPLNKEAVKAYEDILARLG